MKTLSAQESPIASRPARWEWVWLASALSIGAWLRFSHLDLLEFKDDEAVAAYLALKFLKGGGLPLAGLISSIGASNPPLFIYLLAPLFCVSGNLVFVSACIAALGLGAVAVTWHVGRKYYGPLTGAVAVMLFAVSPWAVIYSRKIWAQDFVPIFAVGTLWALHALVLDRRQGAIFWVVLLPLCLIQIHFSGLALAATVVLLLLLLRPAVDWPSSVAGVTLAAILALPYFGLQYKTDWIDFKIAAGTVGKQNYQVPDGMTVHPELGSGLPSREPWWQALAVLNAGRIEDVLGFSARAEVDPYRVWRRAWGSAARYFDESQSLGNALLCLERLAFVAAWGYLLVQLAVAGQWKRRFPFFQVPGSKGAHTTCILSLWIAAPLAVFVAARLWTMLSYFLILYPAHFLVIGAGAETLISRARRWPNVRRLVILTVIAVAMGNLVFMLDFYRFIARYGGAHGNYGSVLSAKEDAIRWLASRTNVPRMIAEDRLFQVNDLGPVDRGELLLRADRPGSDLRFLAMLTEEDRSPITASPLPRRAMVLVMDQNRANFEPVNWQQWPLAKRVRQETRTDLEPLPWNRSAGVTEAKFGPLWLFVVQP